MLTKIPHLARRALLIYVATVVMPIGALLWLGLQSFERQRESVQNLQRDKLASAVEAEARAAAAIAFLNHTHKIANAFFVVERGRVVEPALRSPLPLPVPLAFGEVEHLELALKRPDLALQQYRALLRRHDHESLALHLIARCLSALGRDEEAEDTWRTLATRFPHDLDPAGRPYGIVAAINAGDTVGLFEQISDGRWDLSADQAEYFLNVLAPDRRTPYLDRFSLAREVEAQFRPVASPQDGEIYTVTLGRRLVFYRTDGPDRIAGFVADPAWMTSLEHQLQHASFIEDTGGQSVVFYGGAMAVLLLVLSAGVVIVHRDLSRESRMSRLRSDFVNGVTHELKTPITIMRLYGETLLQQRDLDEPQRRDFYRIISRESARLGRLVDQVLTFSRVERGDARYDLREADPAPVIAGVVDDYSDWLEHSGFSVDRDLPTSMPLVRFDPAAVSQAVVNLLDNAAKYSGSSRRIVVRLAAAGGHVTFEVEDHGLGIPAAEHGRIFDRFYRVANESGRGGSGLGLFMVRHIMAAHGGHADVDSEPGRGSTFRLVFPVVAS